MIDEKLLADLKASQDEEGQEYPLDDLIAAYGELEGAKYYQALHGKKKVADSPQNNVHNNLDNDTTKAEINQDNLDALPSVDFRGISVDTYRHYGCSYDISERRIVIPTILPDGTKSYVAVLTNSKRQELKDAGKVEGTDFAKVKAGKGTRGIFNLDKIVVDTPVLITEGEIDALSIAHCGYSNVIALGGQSVSNLCAWLDNNPAEYQFVILFDNDKAGRNAAPKATDDLLRAGYKAVSNFISNDALKVDANDILTAQGADVLKSRINLIIDTAQVEFPKINFPPPEPPKSNIDDAPNKYPPISQAEIKRMLDFVPDALSYSDWCMVCCALIDWGKSINNLDLARQFFISKSSKDTDKYSEAGCISKWDSFLNGTSGRKITVGSLIKLAQSNGYVLPLTRDLSQSLFESADTDFKRAERIWAYSKDTLRYVYDLDAWAIYDGIKWSLTRNAAANHLYKTVSNMVKAMRKSKRCGRDIKKIKIFETKQKVDSAIALIKGIEEAIVMSTDFDKVDDTAHLLNCRNGTVNLKTGELLPHNPEHYITHCADVDYQPNAQSAVVDNYLQEILPDTETRAAILRYLGYGITGSVTEESAMFARGEGKNGKSTLTKTLNLILGDYAGNVNSDVILAAYHSKDAESACPAIASLRGLRLVIGSDLKGGCKLDDSTIKRLCSRDKITARKLHENPIEFSPTHKFWFNGQYYPELKNVDDNGVNRRLVLVEFTQKFEGDNCDPYLDEKLSTPENKSALLNILVDNAKSWYSAIANGASTGLIFSAAMTKTKSDYIDSQDWFMMAFDELFELTNNPADKLKLSKFRDTIILNKTEAKLLSTTQLNKVIDNGLKKLGIEKKRQKSGYMVYGIKEINSFRRDSFEGDFRD